MRPIIASADPMAIPAEILLSKRVQERVFHGELPQPPYTCRDDGTQNVEILTCPIPTVDLSLLSSQDPLTAQEELDRLRMALSSWGCFQAIGHGIPGSFLDKIRQVGREFFQQSMEEKRKYEKGVVLEMEGYGGDPLPAQGQSLDWSDRLFLEVYPVDRRNLKFWPENPSSFRGLLEDYTIKMKSLTDLVSRAMAKSLKLPENCFLEQMGQRAALQARFNYYSRCQRPDLVLGLKAHSDGSVFTIVLQDDVEGLQVLQSQRWFTIPTNNPQALLVLMADQMEIMTNGIFKSPVHRVLTNSNKERLSVAVFSYPEPDKEIGPEEGLINEETPRIFKTIKGYGDVHWDYYQQGKRALQVAKV